VVANPSYRILVVCTANICRSVMAERFLRRELASRGLFDTVVESCGTLFDDQPASDVVLAVLAEYGIDAADHRSRRFTPEMLAGSDLVITMERRHARELSVALDGASPRIHTLGALVEWLGEAAELVGPPAPRVERCADEREASDLFGSGPDEVADPHGRSKRVHRKAAERIDTLCVGLVDGLYGPSGGS
jgi:protein-tyrosine phosphatase